MTVSDDILIAYIDGELSDDDRRQVEQAAAQDAAIASRIAAHRALASGVARTYGPVADEPVPEALLALFAAAPPQTVVAFKPRRALPAWTAWAAMAACLVLGLAIGSGAQRDGLVAPDMTAGKQLAVALNDQLAASQEGAAIRIGVTFTDKTGAYCRTFQASGMMSGLACRDGADWRVPVLASEGAAGSGEFRTASSMPAAIAAAIDDRITGAPLDASQEAAAKAAGWTRPR